MSTRLADLIPKAADLKTRSARLVRQLAEMPKDDQIQSQLDALEGRLTSILVGLTEFKQQERQNYNRLVEFGRSAETINEDIVLLYKPLANALSKIDQWRSDWQDELAFWQNWRTSFGDDPLSNTAQDTFDSAIRTITTALERIQRQMEALMVSQQRVFAIQAYLDELLIDVEAMITASRGGFLDDFSPAMFSPTYFARFNRWLAYDFSAGVSAVSLPNRAFFVRCAWVMALQVAVFLSIAFGIRKSEHILEGIDSLRFMRRSPFAVGGLVAAVVCWSFYEPMPDTWQLLVEIIILTTTARLVGRMEGSRRSAVLFYWVVAIILTTHLLTIIQLPSPLFRIYLVLAAGGLGILCLRFLFRTPFTGRYRIFAVTLIGMAIASATVAVAEIAGYSALALFIFKASLRTLFIFALAWLFMTLVRGLLESVIRSRAAQKLSFFRNQANAIIDRSTKLMNLFIFILFCGAVLETWRVFTNSWEFFSRILTFGITIKDTRITVLLVLTAAAFLWGAMVGSRLLQLFLTREVFPRRRVNPGIGVSIARLVNYAVLLAGVLLALATLGFELTNLTIIASALSVGIGFGLQTIVNNFVCGLILLFERPVKVGDVIQLGDQWATIRDIGLRATFIETFDQSEIVVPNSDLITNQVTNWTLANRNMRLILSIGVAYGTDVPMVLQTLQDVTRESPRVLKYPEPSIFFMGFGDSSLDFQLRVWIDDIDYMNVVRSELNQAIERQFRERGIEIPFPQRDLHFKSTDSLSIAPLQKGVSTPTPTQ